MQKFINLFKAPAVTIVRKNKIDVVGIVGDVKIYSKYPKCVDCKHYYFDGQHLCKFNKNIDVVSGKISDSSAIDNRMYSSKCGLIGHNFETNLDILKHELNKKIYDEEHENWLKNI